MATMVVAACSLLYELLLAQTLATTMGNTTLRYNVTIGLYIASMGLGAILFHRFIPKVTVNRFLNLEMTIAITGALSPLAVLAFDSLFLHGLANVISYESFLVQSALFIFNHLAIVLVGFLSGLELPLLMELGRRIKEDLPSKVLAFDYLGTMIAAVIFPILLIPNLGLFGIAFLVAFLNLTISLFFGILERHENLVRPLILNGVFLVLVLMALFQYQSIQNWAIEAFYMGGMS